MNYEVVELAKKTFVGVESVTRNDDPKMTQIIGGLWQSFYSGVYQKIVGKTGNKSVGLYCDYGANGKDSYTVLVGTEVDGSTANVGLASKTIPAGKYAVFTVKGSVSEATGNCWKEIWTLPLERTFTGDFEEYQEDCDGKTGTIKIFIAIK